MSRYGNNRLGPKMLIWDLDVIHSRCEEEGDCWLWTGMLGRTGYPVASIEGKPGKLVRRKAVELSGRNPGGKCITAICGEKRCCNPAHLRITSRKDVNQMIWSKNYRVPDPIKFRELAKARGATKLDEQIAAEIRAAVADMESDQVADYIVHRAAALGVHRRTIQQVVSGNTWRVFAPNSSVFNWRPKVAA